MKNKKVSLSIVLPCHNEQDVITHSYNRLYQLIKQWEKTCLSCYEIIMVNNGSTDNTLEKMLKIQKLDSNVIVLDLRTNYGYQGSITAGLYNATKECIVTIDADLQDDPEKIPEMIAKYNEGFELVLGVRKDRSADTFIKRLTANIYYKVLKVLGIKSVMHHGDFRLLSNSLLQDMKKYNERNRFLRGLIFEIESKYACVYYKRTPRQAGESKFKSLDLFSLGWDGITSFSNTPIKFVLFFGFILFLSSLLGICYVLFCKFVFERTVPGWASTLILLLFFAGMQNLFLGIIGEYLSKIFIEVKQRPIFLIRKKYVTNKKK